jgi:lipopolysaccharide transport system ATP-binding protein
MIVGENLGKVYPKRLTAMRLLRYLVPWDRAPREDDFWALRNVSFRLERGQVLGIIGRNGSGKSTLLQMVAGLLAPSEGHVRTTSRVAALLELGAGFNPEFTGWENVYVSGAIYGLDRKAIESRVDNIAAFAGIGSHMDQPVKTYSSGMYARLAFSVAIEVKPEVLLVDEILSVGDLGFQAKCFRRIEELREEGAAIMFVSHDLNAVRMLCDRVMLLRDGCLVTEGDPEKVTTAYIQLLSKTAQRDRDRGDPDVPASARAAIQGIRFQNSEGIETIHPFSGERCRVQYRVVFFDAVETPVVTAQIKTMLGLVVADLTNLFAGKRLPACAKGDALDIQFEFTCNLCPGPFRLGVSVSEMREEAPVPLYGKEVLTLEVISRKNAYGLSYVDDEMTFSHVPADATRDDTRS